MVRFSEDVQPMTALKTRSAEVIERVVRSGRPALITRRGRGVAVVLSLPEFERMQDELAFRHAVEEGARQALEGRLVDHEKALEVLDKFGKIPPRPLRPRKR